MKIQIYLCLLQKLLDCFVQTEHPGLAVKMKISVEPWRRQRRGNSKSCTGSAVWVCRTEFLRNVRTLA